MPFGIGLPEILIFLVVVLLLFGASRVPEIGRSLGKGMREFKDAVTGRDDDDDDRAASLPRAPEDEEKVASPSRERDTVS
jgi:sec-independent protein translocase protein TatA